MSLFTMKIQSRMFACLLPMLFVFTVQAQTVPDEATEAPDIEPEALAVMKGMADYLAAAGEFAYRAESGYDIVQESGAKVEFGESRKVLVERPNRMRIDTQRRDGARNIVVFDSKELWVYSLGEKAYAKAEQKGDLDEAIHYAANKFHLKAPLTELISPNLYENVTERLTGALYLGETVLAGDTCDHLLLSNDYSDFQMWITTGDKPVLKRIVITYREEPGEPQYRVHFLKWDMSPKDTAKKLEFRPPAGSEQIRFYIPTPASNPDKEGGS